IVLPIFGEGDGRMSAEGLDVAPERRHLEGYAIGDDRHRAMLDPGGDRFEVGAARQRNHLLRQRRGGEIDLGHRQTQQGIAYRAANRASLDTRTGERGEYALDLGLLQPGGIFERRWRCGALGGVLGHRTTSPQSISPGLTTPFSMTGG